jgi:hypothetical protein
MSVESWLTDATIRDLSIKIDVLEKEIVCLKANAQMNDVFLFRMGQLIEDKLHHQNVLVISGIEERGVDEIQKLKYDYRQVDKLLGPLELHRSDIIQQKRRKGNIVLWLQDSSVATRALQKFHSNRHQFENVYLFRYKTKAERVFYNKLVEERDECNSRLPVDILTGERYGVENGRKFLWALSNYCLVKKYF